MFCNKRNICAFMLYMESCYSLPKRLLYLPELSKHHYLLIFFLISVYHSTLELKLLELWHEEQLSFYEATSFMKLVNLILWPKSLKNLIEGPSRIISSWLVPILATGSCWYLFVSEHEVNKCFPKVAKNNYLSAFISEQATF